MRRAVVLALLVACGSQPERTTTSTPGTRGPTDAELRAERQHREREEHKAIVTKHRVLESAQQDALGATCEDPSKWAPQHCKPTCYPAEEKDPRAGIKLAGNVELQHHVCQRVLAGDQMGPWLIIEDLDGKKLEARTKRGQFPKPHKKGSWQAEIATALADQRVGKAPRGEVFSVLGGAVRAMKHPITHESLRCVTVAQYTTLPRAKLDPCGTSGKAACEASGNAAARGINLARFRISEAAKLRDAHKDDACRTAALDALATARGLPRWRQYAKLNVGAWTEGLAYKTRFDGVLDEDSLFALASTLATEAQKLLVDCGMVGTPPTTPEHEHAFHSCP
jgi:hypothetical protein